MAAKAATSTVPIVFTSGAHPVAFGLVGSLNKPGGNLTGFTNYFGPLGAKRLELLRELAPTAGVVGILVNPENPNASEHLQNVQEAARALGQTTRVAGASSDAEIEAAFAALVHEGLGAVLVSDARVSDGIKVAGMYAAHILRSVRTGRPPGGTAQQVLSGDQYPRPPAASLFRPRCSRAPTRRSNKLHHDGITSAVVA
jgi:putative ABC transport system substrate-binding protein